MLVSEEKCFGMAKIQSLLALVCPS